MSGGAPVWFCATGRTGLGHLRRVSTIAQALSRRRGRPADALLTNATLAGVVADRAVFGAVERRDRDTMASSLPRGAVAVVDTAVVPGIESHDGPLVLVLRETPGDRVGRFRLPGGRPWDLVIVPNPRDHWMPDDGLGPRVEPTGWIYRKAPRGTTSTGKAEVLIATGGGGGEEIAATLRETIDPILAAARRRGTFTAVQAVGPLTPEAGLLECADRMVDPGGDLHSRFARADAVISTAGYNSVLELAALDVPALLVPIPRSIDDQAARARLWGPRLGNCHEGDAAASASWLADTLAVRRRREPWPLGPSGEDQAADLIMELAG